LRDTARDGGPSASPVQPTPGAVACGITQERECNLSAGKVCCHEASGEPVCKDSQDKCTSAGSWTYRCDEKADCTGGVFCCFYPSNDGSRCVSTCGNEPALCTTSDDCPGKGPCNLYDCQGRTRGICGDLTQEEQTKTRCAPRG
jgi:hypothetical protein